MEQEQMSVRDRRKVVSRQRMNNWINKKERVECQTTGILNNKGSMPDILIAAPFFFDTCGRLGRCPFYSAARVFRTCLCFSIFVRDRFSVIPPTIFPMWRAVTRCENVQRRTLFAQFTIVAPAKTVKVHNYSSIKIPIIFPLIILYEKADWMCARWALCNSSANKEEKIFLYTYQ